MLHGAKCIGFRKGTRFGGERSDASEASRLGFCDDTESAASGHRNVKRKEHGSLGLAHAGGWAFKKRDGVRGRVQRLFRVDAAGSYVALGS